jgi:hypothetical protein
MYGDIHGTLSGLMKVSVKFVLVLKLHAIDTLEIVELRLHMFLIFE